MWIRQHWKVDCSLRLMERHQKQINAKVVNMTPRATVVTFRAAA